MFCGTESSADLSVAVVPARLIQNEPPLQRLKSALGTDGRLSGRFALDDAIRPDIALCTPCHAGRWNCRGV
jgi:hypothetical protein